MVHCTLQIQNNKKDIAVGPTHIIEHIIEHLPALCERLSVYYTYVHLHCPSVQVLVFSLRIPALHYN